MSSKQALSGVSSVYKVQLRLQTLSEQERWIAPLQGVIINLILIGPWDVKVNDKIVEFNTLTRIDKASSLVESLRIDNKTSVHV